jgi:hypothetical protein
VPEQAWRLCGKIEDWCPNIHLLFLPPLTSIHLKIKGTYWLPSHIITT